MEPLDLEERVREHQALAHEPLEPALRRMDEAGERREVERGLLDAALTQELDSARDEELGQPVRRVLVAAHQGEGDRRPPVAGREMKEAADPAFGIAAQDDEAVAVVVATQLVERHAEAALVLALAPSPADAVEVVELALREVGQ